MNSFEPLRSKHEDRVGCTPTLAFTAGLLLVLTVEAAVCLHPPDDEELAELREPIARAPITPPEVTVTWCDDQGRPFAILHQDGRVTRINDKRSREIARRWR